MKTILIVDDSTGMRRLIKACLHNLHDVCLEEAGGGREAIKRLGRGPVDLMTLELGMPDTDGMDVIEAVHRNPSRRNTPIIVVTRRCDMPARVAMQEAGMEHYLTKPFQPEEIFDLACRLLAQADS